MARILFIRTANGTSNLSATPPLGILYLSAVIKSRFPNQFEIKLLDSRIDGKRMGPMPTAAIERQIRSFDPQIIGFSTLSCEASQLKELTALAKSISPDILTIAGGPHPTFAPLDTISDQNLDLAVLGEAEETITGVLQTWNNRDWSGLSGVAYRENGHPVIRPLKTLNDKLDTIPFPDWDLIDLDLYNSFFVHNMLRMQAGKKYAPIFTSRACPYNCTYCHSIFGKKFRGRSPENVLEEIRILHDRYGVRELHIFDDVFNLDRARAIKICQGIVDAGWKLKIAFPNGLRGDILDDVMLQWLKRAGAYMLVFAVETASPKLQKLVKKNINLEKVRSNIVAAERMGFITKAFFMLGFPTETEKEIQATIDFALGSPLHLASFFKVVPQPGTELFNQAVQAFPQLQGKYDSYDYYSVGSYFEEMTGINLHRYQKMAYLRFYMNPVRVYKLIRLMPRKIYILKGLLALVQICLKRFDPWLKRRPNWGTPVLVRPKLLQESRDASFRTDAR